MDNQILSIGFIGTYSDNKPTDDALTAAPLFIDWLVEKGENQSGAQLRLTYTTFA
jgi:hypothetical protein